MAREEPDNFETWATAVVLGKINGFRATVLRLLLRVLSWLFRLIVKLRLHLFRRGWKTQSQMGTLVLSIGNVTLGGTGKTPVVELFAKNLRDRGRNVAILSRGYKSKQLETPQQWKSKLTGSDVLPESMPKLVSDGSTPPILEVSYAGDEPFMLAKNLEDVKVIVDKDRVKSARFAINEFDTDTLILDDGMQFLKIWHSLDIILIDANAPFGNEYLLPRGTLREPPRNIKRADYIFITKCKSANNLELIQRIRKYNRSAEIIECKHGPVQLENVFTGEIKPLAFLKGKYVAAISGIAVPESFEEKLEENEAIVQFHRTFSDHYNFTQEDIDSFMRRCVRRDVELIVTTEKDAVRFHRPAELDVPVYFLRIEVDILSGHEIFESIIDRICATKKATDPLLYQPEEIA